jgi:alkaline phosphatase
MKKFTVVFSLFLLLFFATNTNLSGQDTTYVKGKIRNVIIMIPDGTSISVLSLSRWYKHFSQIDQTNSNCGSIKAKLAIDPYLCGLVKTHSSNAPIGDSAPTSSWYFTGFPSQTSFVAMYPPTDPVNNLVFIDTLMAYQPLMTVMEAARLRTMKTGIVTTCEIIHATPADISAHYYDRDKEMPISKQMAHNGLDVVIGGGVRNLVKEKDTLPLYKSLLDQGYKVFLNSSLNSIPDAMDQKFWALFSEKHMQYAWDGSQSPGKRPSLKDMTLKAIYNLVHLDTAKNGFFLMVEGSLVDFAAHANDVTGMLSEFLDFDEAVQAAIDFAKRDSHTVVIVCPDHGNSGFSIGNDSTGSGKNKYDKLGLTKIMEPLSKMKEKDTAKSTLTGAAKFFVTKYHGKADTSAFRIYLRKFFPDKIFENSTLAQIAKKINSVKDTSEKSIEDSIKEICALLTESMYSKSFFGFTTTGHTAEDVFLAIYNPDPLIPLPGGLVTGTELNRFLCALVGMPDCPERSALSDSTKKYFVKFMPNPEKDVFRIYSVITKSLRGLPKIQSGDIILEVQKHQQTYIIPAYKNFYYVVDQELGETRCMSLQTVTVWVDKANKNQGAFFLPASLVAELNEQ